MKKYRLLACLLLLFGCESADSSWFPLGEGYWWQYSATRMIKGEAHVQKLILANLAPVEIDGKTLFPRKRADGKMAYYAETDTGIYRVDPADGSRALLLPAVAKVGSRWQAPSRILFLHVTGAFAATYNRRIKQDIAINYLIDSTDDTVKVTAGRFTHCLRVTGFGSIYGGGGSLKEFMAIDTINIETTDWYAPGVGLIKRTRKEYTYPLKAENLYTEELEAISTG